MKIVIVTETHNNWDFFVVVQCSLLLWLNQVFTMLAQVVFSKKYGVDLVRFTHAPNAIICASKNNWDESLRYLSLHDNRYLRYFKGHRDKV